MGWGCGLAPAISGDRLLLSVMQSAAIADIELERLLTAIRLALLEMASASGDASVVDERLAGEETLDFCCALARQCFLNEQVFACTDEELEEARRLRDRVVAALASGAAIAELQLAVVAAYFPLHSLPGAASLLDRTWSDAIEAVLVQQVREPAEERTLRGSIPALTAVENDVSRKVQQQYEENPYPRWAQADPPGQPLLFEQYLRRRLPAAVFQNSRQAANRRSDRRVRHRPTRDRDGAAVRRRQRACRRLEPRQPCLCQAQDG